MNRKMNELYNNLGFTANPFQTFSAEDEKEILNKFYIKPIKYNSIENSIKHNISNYIFGKRGNGKTALLYSLINDLDIKNTFHIVIDDFSEIDIKTNKNETSFLKFTIKQLVNSLLFRLINDKDLLKNMNNTNSRNEIATIIFSYLETVSKESYVNDIEKIKGCYTANNLKQFFNNYMIIFANSLASATLDMLSTTIANSFGMQSFIQDKEHMYIKSLRIDKLKDISNNSDIKLIFNKLISLINELGFTTITIFVDRVDENPSLKNLPKKISDFILPIAANTTLTKDTRFSFQFLLWDKLKEPLEQSGVRFDKVIPISIDLTPQELQTIMKKRLQYYSNNKIDDLNMIINSKYHELIYDLADTSPRDMLRLLYFIYNSQQNLSKDHYDITEEAFDQGVREYIYEYNFYYNYPITTSNKNLTVYEFIANLYLTKKVVFHLTDYSKACNLKKSTSTSHINKMLDMKLVSKIRLEGKSHYKIVSKLLAHALNRELIIKNVHDC